MHPRLDIHFPSEIWSHIFSYLTPESLVKASQVNHLFHSLANDNPLWQQHIEKYFPFLESTDHSYSFLNSEQAKLSAKSIFQKACERYQKKLNQCIKRQVAVPLLLAAIRKLISVFNNNIQKTDDKKSITHDQDTRAELEHFFPLVFFLNSLIGAAAPYRHSPPRLWTLSLIIKRAAANHQLKSIYPLISLEITSETLTLALTHAALAGYLAPVQYLLNIDKEINAGKAFKMACGHNCLAVAQFLLENYALSITSIDKGWALRWAFKKNFHQVVKYLLKQFNLFHFLPTLKEEAWSKLFKLKDLYIVIQRNGYGFSGETYLVILQLNDQKTIHLELNHIEQIALWLQRQCFPIQQWDNPEFHQSYLCIMGSEAYHCLAAELYCIGKLTLSKQIHQNFKVITPKINQPELAITLYYSKPLTPAFNLELAASSSLNEIIPTERISEGLGAKYNNNQRLY